MSNSVAVNQSEVKGYHIYGVRVVSQAQAAKQFGREDAAQKAPMQGSMYFTLNSPEYYLYNIAYKTYNVPLSIDWRWLLAYHERLSEGATPVEAYDYADVVAFCIAAGAPLDMAQATADVTTNGIRYAVPWTGEDEGVFG
jgi:hypothetical protein